MNRQGEGRLLHGFRILLPASEKGCKIGTTMTLGQLTAFQAVSRHLSLTKAARELKVSEPTIAKQIHSLEKQLGAKLHTSTGQGVRLTEEGELFLSGIEPFLQRIHDMEEVIKNRTNGEATCLRVGGSIAASTSLLPEMLRTFKRNHAKVQPVLRTGPSKVIEELLLSSKVQVAVITNPSYDPLITLEPLRPIGVIAVVSAKHRVAKKTEIDEQELIRTPLILVKEGSIARQIEKIGLKLNTFMQCESLEAAKGAVLAGLGMGFFYRSSVELDLRAGYLRSIQAPRLREIDGECFIAYLAHTELHSNALDFLALLRQHARKSKHKHNMESSSKTVFENQCLVTVSRVKP